MRKEPEAAGHFQCGTSPAVSPYQPRPKRDRAPFSSKDDRTEPSAVDAMDRTLDEDQACPAQTSLSGRAFREGARRQTSPCWPVWTPRMKTCPVPAIRRVMQREHVVFGKSCLCD